MTTQTHIALQIVGTLSKEELQMFVNELDKRHIKAVPKTKPKKKYNIPSTEVLKNIILTNHRNSFKPRI